MIRDQSSISKGKEISGPDAHHIGTKILYAGEAADYVAKIAAELTKLTQDVQLSFLAHMLSMVHDEAASIAREQQFNQSKT